MSEWEYSPIENIAFALQDIANTLERIEKLMPIPGGDITGSEIWTYPPVEPQAVEEEKCPCFSGGTCPTNGEHTEE